MYQVCYLSSRIGTPVLIARPLNHWAISPALMLIILNNYLKQQQTYRSSGWAHLELTRLNARLQWLSPIKREDLGFACTLWWLCCWPGALGNSCDCLQRHSKSKTFKLSPNELNRCKQKEDPPWEPPLYCSVMKSGVIACYPGPWSHIKSNRSLTCTEHAHTSVLHCRA